MPTSFHDLDGWSFLVGFGCAYLTMAIIFITLLNTSEEIKDDRG